jgi:hypothetical protein
LSHVVLVRCRVLAHPVGRHDRDDAQRGSAEAEKRPARPVPHLHDLVLRDQLRVMADDILATNPTDDLLDRATQATNDVRDSLVRA